MIAKLEWTQSNAQQNTEHLQNPTTGAMRGSRNFRQGEGPGQSDKKKALTKFFLAHSLFYRSRMVNFKEIHHFSRFRRGSNIFQGGGATFSRVGGVQLLIPIETHITCDFPGRVRTPCPPPLWIRTWEQPVFRCLLRL